LDQVVLHRQAAQQFQYLAERVHIPIHGRHQVETQQVQQTLLPEITHAPLQIKLLVV
jgi:hypothetical protein